jgi:hypothetical protein
MRLRIPVRLLLMAGALLLIAAAALAQRGRSRSGFAISNADFKFPAEGEFHYLRMEYYDAPYARRFGGGFGYVSRRGQANGWWAQDFPDAENHFTFALTRLTLVDIGEPVHYPLTDDAIFDYPWMYVTQAGNWDLSDEEIRRMREYFDRGGFLMNDDTWGDFEQSQFEAVMHRVFPDREILEMNEDHPMMHVMYTIRDKDRTWIPGSRHLCGRGMCQPAGSRPRWYAIHDSKNRAVVAISYDTDIGDAWEFADDPYYPEAMTTLAFHYGMNYLIYAMTH